MRTVTDVIDGCVNCHICVRECGFLTLHGTPGEICDRHRSRDLQNSPVFACNLCGLCNTVCPKTLDITSAFLDLRRQIQQAGQHTPATVSSDSRHKSICSYEKAGCSTLFSLHHLPPGCDTVFFPGCTLTATRSSVTQRTYSHLQSIYPNCGIVLDCCGKPSHDLGLEGTFQPLFSRLKSRLEAGGVKKIITACPSCHVTFEKYFPECTTRTIYEELAENPPPLPGGLQEIVTVHDTCTSRNTPVIHESVRTLLSTTGTLITEGKHNREKALCCGEGAAASFIAPEVTAGWKNTRTREANGYRVITYCAGCSSILGKDLQTTHLLDLLFDYERAIAGKEQNTRSPFTYFRRLLFKWQIARSKTTGAAHIQRPYFQ
jgi:Fe-S oxidoreductase